MPNHVTHKITFSSDKAQEIFSVCCPEGHLDFNTLIPEPLHMYRGDLSSDDEEDFACNWSSWNRANCGTKWNAYSSSVSVEGDHAVINFDTAWSIPYPFLAAFANKFNIPFEHRYFDEGHNFWGIEKWDKIASRIVRTEKRQSHEADKAPLCIELKGYDPREDEHA